MSVVTKRVVGVWLMTVLTSDQFSFLSTRFQQAKKRDRIRSLKGYY